MIDRSVPLQRSPECTAELYSGMQVTDTPAFGRTLQVRKQRVTQLQKHKVVVK